MAHCLVTGGNGFLGRHLVDRLVAAGHQITLLLRTPTTQANQLLIETWQEQAFEQGGNVTVWQGDLTRSDLSGTAIALNPFDHIYHLAAVYDLAADRDRTLLTNVEGTRNLLSKMDSDHFSGTLHFVSSIAIAGNFKGEFTEAMFDEGQEHPHVYNESKFLSEQLVRAWRDKQDQFTIRIYRPSAIVGDSKTGAIDKLDGPYYGFVLVSALRKRVPAWLPLVAPRIKAVMDMVPVDYVADALLTLSMLDKAAIPEGQFCFHLTDPKALTLTKAFNRILKAADGPRIRATFPLPAKQLNSGTFSLIKSLKGTELIQNTLLESLNIPPTLFDAMMPEVLFKADKTIALLSRNGITRPSFEDYADTLWDYYNRHLDPAKTTEARSRKAFQGKIVLITGGSSGIGLASAKRAAAYGARIILVARHQDKLEHAAELLTPIANESGGTVDIQAFDISQLDQCDELVAYILEQYGYVDILFNNAGHSIRRSINKSLDRFHDLERTMQINYFGAARLILGLLPCMVERKSGHIIHSSTMGTMAPTPRFGAYLASKSALDAFMDALAAEYADRKIYATSIKFPLVKTEMIAPTKAYKDAPAASPEFAAQLFVNSVLERPRKQISGTGKIMGATNLFAPNLMTQLYNYWYTLWPDDKDDYPQHGIDRAIVKNVIPKSPI